MAMDHQGIMAIDITTYGNYGWASVNPIRTIEDLKKTKLRIGEAAVNKLTYKAWGINPVVMPWPDVPIALKQGVIDSLDHTPIVCNITKKFEVCKFSPRSITPRACLSGSSTRPGLTPCRRICKRYFRNRKRNRRKDPAGNPSAGNRRD